MADQTKIDQFINLTGVDADRARFYIESAGGNVEVFNYPLILNIDDLCICLDYTIESKTRIYILKKKNPLINTCTLELLKISICKYSL